MTRTVRSPSTLAGYSSVGFPSIVVPMGFGTQGAADDAGVPGPTA